MELKSELQLSLKNCFTCLCQSEEGMQISSVASDSDSVTIVELLTKHFWFQQDDFNEQQHLICWSCWNRLDEFHRFYQEVEQNHRTLNQEPPKVSGCEVKPKLMDDEDFNYVNEIQHDELVLKEENWVEPDEEGSAEELKLESSSDDDENSEKGERELEESPLANRLSRPCKANLEKRIGEQVDSRQAKNLVRDLKQRGDDDEFIKTHMQYICTVCKNNCPSFNQHAAHMMNMHKMKGCITCCGKRYYKRIDLLEHVQRLQDPDRFKCDVCHKILINSAQLRKHKQARHITDEQKTYCCDRCPRRFVRTSLLEYHLKGHDNLENGTFKCLHCEKPFMTRYRLNRHVKIIHASFICDVCEKGFHSKPDLLRHKEQHELSSKELRVQCDICQIWLKNKLSKKSHCRRHTKLPVPVSCDICGHVALNTVALSYHKRIQHRTESSFACQKCGKNFQRAIDLHKHRIIMHYEGTLYPCNFCDKSFIHLCNMKTHQRIKHPKEWSERKN